MHGFFSILAYLKKLFPKSGLVFKYYQGSILSPLKGRLASSRPLNEQQVLLSNTLHAFLKKNQSRPLSPVVCTPILTASTALKVPRFLFFLQKFKLCPSKFTHQENQY
jgi:hypothetical protein